MKDINGCVKPIKQLTHFTSSTVSWMKGVFNTVQKYLLQYTVTKSIHFDTIAIMYEYTQTPTCFGYQWTIIRGCTVV